MQFTAHMKFKYTSVMEFSSAEGGSSVQREGVQYGGRLGLAQWGTGAKLSRGMKYSKAQSRVNRRRLDTSMYKYLQRDTSTKKNYCSLICISLDQAAKFP
jgi:hypothetical protein